MKYDKYIGSLMLWMEEEMFLNNPTKYNVQIEEVRNFQRFTTLG